MATFRNRSRAGFVFMAFLIVGFATATRAVEFAGGTGEPNDPYQIATAEQLIAIGSDPNLSDRHFILTMDIDLDPNLPGGKIFGRAVIAPQFRSNDGITGAVFSGVFDGNDHTISRLTIRGRSYLGLFGRISGSVKNVRLLDVDISGSASGIGSLAGVNDEGTVIQCWSSGFVEGERDVGGLVGYNQGDIAGSCSSSTVTGMGTGPGMGTYVGGLVGGNAGSVTASYSTGVVAGNAFVGGLVGWNDRCITASYSTAGVAGMNDIGGFVGFNNGSIVFCYSTGLVTGTEYVGGFAGVNFSDGAITSSFWDIEISGTNDSEGGTGKTTAEMQMTATFVDAGWDFDSTWTVCEGVSYPRLWWEEVDCGTVSQTQGR